MNYSLYDWNEYAFKNKSEIKDLDSIFIAAPREISKKRFIHIVKEFLPKGNILLGIAKEDYIAGFENQEQFKTLKLDLIEDIVSKVNGNSKSRKINIVEYFQRDLVHIIEAIKPKKCLFINGSWKLAFHQTQAFYSLVKNKIEYELISAFTDETEALDFKIKTKTVIKNQPDKILKEEDIFKLVQEEANKSFDWIFQVGAVLVKNKKIILTSHNTIVPFETYTMLNGSEKEKNFTYTNDQSASDTNHAETEILTKALENKIDLKDTTLYLNVLPCPNCARILSRTKIKEIVYQNDHSEGFAYKLLKKAGKVVRRYLE